MSSTVYWRSWKHLLLYWVSSALFTTERTAKWQMTSERRWCKNRAVNRGADLFFFWLGSVSQKKTRGTFCYGNPAPIVYSTASRWLRRDEKRSHRGGEGEVERWILWPWQHDAVETLPVQIVALLRCFCFVFVSSNHRVRPPTNSRI